MGACATKPKVAKDGDKAPVLRPESAKEEAAAAAEVKSENVVPVVKEEITEKEKTVDNKVNEIVDDDDDDDDQTAKRRSLSHLFKENKQANELAESEATTNPEKQESTEIDKPQNPIIEERSVTLNPIEEVKQSETEIAIEAEKQEEKPVEINTEKQEEKPVENAEKQVNIVTDEKFADAQATIVTEKSLEPEEKQVTIVTETSLEPKEKQEEKQEENAEKQENIVTDEKFADARATISSEKSLEPEEIKQVTIVTELSLEPTEKQESTVSEKSAEITESTSAVVDTAPVIEKVIEIKSSQPEKEEKGEEAK